jgi:hypothetical protein
MPDDVTARRTRLVLALGGVLAGHALAFGSPVAHVHGNGVAHLHVTVHGYLPLLAGVVVPAALVALVVLAVTEVRERTRHLRLGDLLALQTGLFLAQESLERIAAGGSLSGIVGDPVLWTGLGAQIVVAGAVLGLARTITLLARGRLLTALAVHFAAVPGRFRLPVLHLPHPVLWLASAARRRAPPFTS